MSRRRTEMGMLAVFIAVIMVGWGLYSIDYDHVDCDVRSTPDGVEVDMHGFMPADFNYMITSGADVPDVLYYYLDETLPAESTLYVQSETFRVLDGLLGVRGMSPGVRTDAVQMHDLMESQIDTGQASGKAAVFCSGAVPYTLVSGVENLLDEWICAGGTVYWMGSAMGTKVAAPEGILEDQPYAFFPDASVSNGEERHAYNQSEWSYALGMNISDCSNGLNVNAVPGAVSLGLTDEEGFSTLAECPRGDGRIYVVGFELGFCSGTLNSMNIADAIMSGVDSDTVLVKEGSGQKGYWDRTFVIEAEVHPGDVLRFTFGAPYVSGGFVKTF